MQGSGQINSRRMKQLHKHYWKTSDWYRKGCEATQINEGFYRRTGVSIPTTAMRSREQFNRSLRATEMPPNMSWLFQLLFQKGKGHICQPLTNVWAALSLFKCFEMTGRGNRIRLLTSRAVEHVLVHGIQLGFSKVMLFQAQWDMPHGVSSILHQICQLYEAAECLWYLQ